MPRSEAGIPDIEVEEDSETFEENSYKKAYEIMKLAGEMTIADDSGLMVDALDGAPGVYSAVFFRGWGQRTEATMKNCLHCLKMCRQKSARLSLYR